MLKLDRIILFSSVVVIAGAVLFLGIRLVKPQTAPDEQDYTLADSVMTQDTGITVRVTESKANKLLSQHLPADLYLGSPVLSFNADGSVSVTGVLNLRRAAVENIDAAKSLRGITSLLPEEIGFTAALSLSVVNGALHVTPSEIAIMGYTVPPGIIPASVTDAVARAITEAAAGTGLHITGVAVEKGALTVGLE